VPLLYAVRCRFIGEPRRERDWNEWYLGHLEVLMAVRGFLAGQRFRTAASPDDRPYLALYRVESQEVFNSRQYLGVWGFASWREQIDNWSRDLFAAGPGEDLAFATTVTGGRLRAAFLTAPADGGLDPLAALTERRANVHGATVCGLDRSCSAMVWHSGDEDRVGEPFPEPAGMEVVQALYEPITPCLTGSP
jgi:hypothetical protein